MKKIQTFLLTVILMSFSQNLSAQENNSFKEFNAQTYIIVENGNVTNIQPYIDALNTANLNNHRLKSERNTIGFEEGVKVVIFSAEEVLANGITSINPNDFPSQIENYTPPVFKLANNNYIIESKKYTPSYKKVPATN